MKKMVLSAAISRFQQEKRRGIFFALAAVCLFAALTFVGMSVDLGMITVTKTRMQSAADSAALAAAQEIVVGIREAGEQGVTDVQAVQIIAAGAARDMAEYVTQQNGFYLEKNTDVSLGNRILGDDGVSYVETWGTPPYNMVKVDIRMDNPDMTAPDAKLPLIFAPVTGTRAHKITTSATAFIESRDIVAVLDYSGSMSFDSIFRSDTVARLGKPAVEDGLDDIWQALVDSNVRFSDDLSIEKFPATGFGSINSGYGTYVSSSTTSSIYSQLGLEGSSGSSSANTDYYLDWTWTNGYGDGAHYFLIEGQYRWEKYISGPYASGVWRIKSDFTGGWWNPSDSEAPGYYTTSAGTGYVPFPQEGTDSNGLKGKPSESESEALWHGYINYVKGNDLNSYGYQKRYGYRTLMQYLIVKRRENEKSEDLWRAPIYPHHAMKEGITILASFLNNLGYGDHMGLVTYATTSKIETGIDEPGADSMIDLGDNPLTSSVMDIDAIQRQKQPGHYNGSTAIGYGLEDAKDLLNDHGRYGAQKAILLMTDGQSNVTPSGFGTDSLPEDWDWDLVTDFDGDGEADVEFDSSYTSGGNGDGNWKAALHSFVKAKEASDAGYVVHTISMGSGADTKLMQAIADYSGGEYVHVASGTSNAQMEEQLEAAFAVLAGQVPPARLLIGDE